MIKVEFQFKYLVLFDVTKEFFLRYYCVKKRKINDNFGIRYGIHDVHARE